MTESARRLELDKILAQAAEFCVLGGSKRALLSLEPTGEIAEAERRVSLTAEARRLLFELGAGGIEAFPEPADALDRAEKGATLSCGELVGLAALLRSARLCASSVLSLPSREGEGMKELAERLAFDEGLEKEVGDKIRGENELADTASEKLYAIRREMRLLGERIRARLSGYLTGEERKFLQDGIVTVRGDRYVLPVKAEYKRSVRGFVHDRSATGATVFIEPEEVLEMNNELRSLALDEREETERILAELSRAFGGMADRLRTDLSVLCEIDTYYARAAYGYRTKSVRPALNARGVLDIVKGRHPLLDAKTAVPVSVKVGEEYDFLLISGANTGGKTVTLKMCGLFCLMAACGFFVPAAEGTRIPVFRDVYCDVGDSQSIEENLSTFSSHILNLRSILEEAGKNCFVLIDEPGGGTDPEEGQAIARAVLSALARKGCRGIVTTHFGALKEYAYSREGMQNGCMEFDAQDHKPLYRLKIGAPGSSNALAICARLGLDAAVIEEARGYLSEGAKSYEATLTAAEEERIRAEKARAEAEEGARVWRERVDVLEKEEEKFRAEKEKFLTASKAQARRIVAERTARAEELLGEMEALFRKESLTEADLFRARTLKNAIGREEGEEETPPRALPVDAETLKAGDDVFVASLGAAGKVLSVRREKGIAEVQAGPLRVRSKISDLYQPPRAARSAREEKKEVRVVRNLSPRADLPRECNVIGMVADEALPEIDAFLDSALLAGRREVRIVHGMGTGKLRAAVHAYLKKDARVEGFRLGRYGEGESGVTVVTLK